MRCCAARIPIPKLYAARVRNSDFGRRFQAGNNPNLPMRVISLSARSPIASTSPCSPRMSDGHLQLKRSCAGQHGLELRNGLQLQAPLSEQVCA
jgi:hypothetical protein